MAVRAGLTREQIRDQITRMNPASRDAVLGDLLYDALTTINALVADVATLRTKHNAVTAKLDADAGVTDTNYTSLQQVPALTAVAVTLPEDRT